MPVTNSQTQSTESHLCQAQADGSELARAYTMHIYDTHMYDTLTRCAQSTLARHVAVKVNEVARGTLVSSSAFLSPCRVPNLSTSVPGHRNGARPRPRVVDAGRPAHARYAGLGRPAQAAGPCPAGTWTLARPCACLAPTPQTCVTAPVPLTCVSMTPLRRHALAVRLALGLRFFVFLFPTRNSDSELQIAEFARPEGARPAEAGARRGRGLPGQCLGTAVCCDNFWPRGYWPCGTVIACRTLAQHASAHGNGPIRNT